MPPLGFVLEEVAELSEGVLDDLGEFEGSSVLKCEAEGFLWVWPDRLPGLSSRTDPQEVSGDGLRIDPIAPGAEWQPVAYGLRNPWRFSFDGTTGDLWIGDVGAARWEEVDFRPAAQIGTLANYGWSRYEARASYNPAVALAAGEVVFPVWAYPHTYRPQNLGECSVIGGYVYRGTRVRSLRGRYVFGDLCSGFLWSFRVGAAGRASRVTRLKGRVPSLSSFGEGARGELYAVGYGGSLYVLR